ncbi:glycoside hydrolase family 5 protein [Nocardia arthritidis]|uniref:Cellulase family glycosylhydrolase n=1 Tax=Nocardia arthritidis TaxID=228602 RepID=A0A6G9YLS6_9NOCA|nr:cellulase family glycosylhydrolase [Nocardia arthritidis]QIS14164.1 cellulase family glycosylhydrolase [Nocardia arthritidis]
MSIDDINRRLARTINFPADFGADIEKGWTVPLGEQELDLVEAAGFSAVRIGLCWAAHTGPAPDHEIDPVMLAGVAEVTDLAVERGLAVVLTNFLDPELIAEPPRHLDRLLHITRQVATRFADRPDSVALEPFAEPRGALDPLWNDYLNHILTELREVDAARAVVIGPAAYNNLRTLPDLVLPEHDRNLIVTVHQYWPITFTMQGEQWLGADTPFGDPLSWLGTTWDGTDRQREELAAGFDAVAAWAAAAERPIFVGEFGATHYADLRSRVSWTSYNRQLAEEHGFSWGAWSFGPTYALFDQVSGEWNKPLLRALIDLPH